MSELTQLKKKWIHFNPVRVVNDSLSSLGKYVDGQHILLVTTPGFSNRGVVEVVRQVLHPKNVIVWDEVISNPDIANLDKAIFKLKKNKFDYVIGLGGGSCLDTAKVFAASLVNNGAPTLTQIFCDDQINPWQKRLPLLLIPTTAGTGSEVTQFATLWDHREYKKHSLTGDYIFPDIAFLDENLTLTLSEENTLYPALDTLSHALESIWNKNSTPISRIYSFKAIETSVNALKKIKNDYHNIQLRKELMIASSLAGIAISQTRTAIAHAISYPLTSHLKIPHGLACSFTLPYLIDKYIKYSDNVMSKEEHDLLNKTKNLILSQKLDKKIEKYCNKIEVINLIQEENLNSRKDNYLIKLDFPIKEILTNSLNI